MVIGSISQVYGIRVSVKDFLENLILNDNKEVWYSDTFGEKWKEGIKNKKINNFLEDFSIDDIKICVEELKKGEVSDENLDTLGQLFRSIENIFQLPHDISEEGDLIIGLKIGEYNCLLNLERHTKIDPNSLLPFESIFYDYHIDPLIERYSILKGKKEEMKTF